MNWRRRFTVLGLALSILTGVSCTTENSPTGISSAEPVQQSSPLVIGSLLDSLGGVGGTVNGILGGAVGVVSDITNLLTCKEQKYVSVTETIGSQGGTIQVGEHTLQIPQGALTKKVKIKAEQMRGRTNSVRFSPEGLRFEKPAALTMSYKNCAPVPLPKSIVYTTEKFKILEVLRSLDLFKKRSVTAPIDHFSRYAVAF